MLVPPPMPQARTCQASCYTSPQPSSIPCSHRQLPRELMAHGAGALATAVGGGYSNYIAVSNTAIHRKCGGRDKRSCFCAAAVALGFFLVHPLFVVVGYVPTLVVAATCVYIGIDFLWDNLVAPGVSLSALSSWAVLALFESLGRGLNAVYPKRGLQH